MTAGAWVALLLGFAALGFVAAPLFRKDAAEQEQLAAAHSERQDLTSRREMVLAALKDLEDDYATGKIDDNDYNQLKSQLSEKAVDIMKRLDQAS